MGKARELKRRADTILEEVFRSLFEEIDTDKLRREVETLKDAAPEFEPAQHARTLIRRTAIRCAAAGAVTGLPSGLVAIGTVGADLAHLGVQPLRPVLARGA